MEVLFVDGLDTLLEEVNNHMMSQIVLPGLTLFRNILQILRADVLFTTATEAASESVSLGICEMILIAHTLPCMPIS